MEAPRPPRAHHVRCVERCKCSLVMTSTGRLLPTSEAVDEDRRANEQFRVPQSARALAGNVASPRLRAGWRAREATIGLIGRHWPRAAAPAISSPVTFPQCVCVRAARSVRWPLLSLPVHDLRGPKSDDWRLCWACARLPPRVRTSWTSAISLFHRPIRRRRIVREGDGRCRRIDEQPISGPVQAACNVCIMGAADKRIDS